ncbi:MAG TPA: hypothetical protein PLO12_07920, partial [Solirubrobacterales bacterium]|nr:hypothetical protein [Solirubrobacterales bacterium]
VDFAAESFDLGLGRSRHVTGRKTLVIGGQRLGTVDLGDQRIRRFLRYQVTPILATSGQEQGEGQAGKQGRQKTPAGAVSGKKRHSRRV